MNNKLKQVLFFCSALCIPIFIFKMFHKFGEGVQSSHAARPVNEWKLAIRPVGFKGVVSNKGKFSFTDRTLFSIEIKDPVIENGKAIPMGCEFFQYENGTLRFAAYSQTVGIYPYYGLDECDIIEKKVNNDTLFVSDPQNTPKYFFELFDGIANDWKPLR